ncbi:DsbA family oxidoreductase [Paenibacillus roseipurpureus]|uniref:DsbA family oxidoreductase n=1 Tax=Paenibacillus roseopurpureus TaxID=2918901 RepID=A0AA96RKB3_9BACL|nr:DsbA family oxidoreductase [Paenibacillus sp. MBLB1832]WNR44136.1 DsbA family oxidoreductase [Paenibacillus sp. MBLB1832]
MQVEIWSDFACPFCYIGKRRFEKALEEFAHKDAVEVIYRSFELDPNSPKHVPHDVYDMLSSKYGMSRTEAISMNQQLSRQAAADGLDFQFDQLVLTNTFDAHRLQHLAARAGKGAQMAELLFRGYFTKGQNLSDPILLADLAAEAGLDREDALAALSGAQFGDKVREDEGYARQLGIRGVPYYVINRKHAMSGAQPVSSYLNALQMAWQDQQAVTAEASSEAGDAACADGVCVVPEK